MCNRIKLALQMRYTCFIMDRYIAKAEQLAAKSREA